jgi:DNA-binding transcriptional MocR family regulator
MKSSNSMNRVIQDLRVEIAAAEGGQRLPSVRELMARHGVGPATVERALAALTREGIVEAQPGRGTFVAPQASAAPRGHGDFAWQSAALGSGRASDEALAALVDVPPPGALVLSGGYPSEELQAIAQLNAAMGRALRRPGAWDRMPLAGLETLRHWFARGLGGGFTASDVVICAGGQSAIATVCRALAPPGAPLLMESPTYLGAIVAARAAGLVPVPVPTDGDGVRPEALAESFSRSGARLFYCQPTFANPTGAVLAPARRAVVLEVVREAGALLIEDDWARDLALDGAAPPPLASADPDGHVIHIRSLTKTTAPSLRLAAIAARGAALQRLRAAAIIEALFIAGPLQEAALQLVTAPAWPRYLRALRTALRQRRDALVAACRDKLSGASVPRVPTGGLHLWVRLPDTLSDVALVERAIAAKLVVSPGRPWFPAEPTGSFLRLSFGGAPAALLERGVAQLAELIAGMADRDAS